MILFQNNIMDELWNKGCKTKLISHGENVRQFIFKPPNGSYSLPEVYHRADFVRRKLEQYHPGEYVLMVTVRDKHVAGWRSGKFRSTSDPNIYIYSPEEYDKEFNNIPGQIDLPELVAEDVRVYVKRIKKISQK